MAIKEDVATYLRADTNDATLSAIVDSAIAFITEATGKPYIVGDAVYELAIKMLSAHWYDNRGAVMASANDIPFSVETMLNHIKLVGDNYGD